MTIGRSENAKRRKHNTYAALVFIVVISIIGALVYYVATKEEIDARFCPRTIPGHTVILVDKTDELGYTQRLSLITDVSAIIRNLEPGTLVSVFALSEKFEANAKPVIQLCRPSNFEDGDSELTKSRAFSEKRFNEKFEGPILQQVQKLTQTSPDKSSPIFEMLQLVGIQGFKSAAIDTNLALVIYSDFLHNTKDFGMYRGTYSFNIFASSDYGIQSIPKLGSVSIRMKYLMHTPTFQGGDNRKFWLQLFGAAGASIESIEQMEGG